MDLKELAWTQIVLGFLGILGFLLSTIKISPPTFEGIFTISNSLGLFFGLFAILTGIYNLKIHRMKLQ
jgi:hypothetical protein